jgi:hypothetical protein
MWDLFKDHLDLLMACNVTNANFFRAPRVRKDNKKPHQLSWHCACPSTRKDLKYFCGEQLKIIVEQLRPKAIVVTGGVLWQSNLKRRWNEEAALFGVRAIHVMHPSAWGQTEEVRAARDAAIRKIAGL